MMGWASKLWSKAKTVYQKARKVYRKGKEIYVRNRDRYLDGRSRWQTGLTTLGISRGTLASVLLFGAAMVGAFLPKPADDASVKPTKPALVAERQPGSTDGAATDAPSTEAATTDGEFTGAGRPVLVAATERLPGVESDPGGSTRSGILEQGADAGAEVIEAGLPTGGA